MSVRVFSQLYYHFIWTTKNRQPQLTGYLHNCVLEVIAKNVKDQGGRLIALNAMPDHVHLLVSLSPTMSPSFFIGKVKGASSYNCNKSVDDGKLIYWQNGFGLLTVREGDLDILINYIENHQLIHEQRKHIELFEKQEPDAVIGE